MNKNNLYLEGQLAQIRKLNSIQKKNQGNNLFNKTL